MKTEYNTNKWVDRWQLRYRRVEHWFLGRRRGCSCNKCFDHPKRKIPNSEILRDRVRLSELEQKVRLMERLSR